MLYEKGFALVFETSQGCRMSCSGCQINKNLSGLPSEEKLDELLALFKGLKAQGQTLAEFEFGPTDMVYAANRQEMLTHPKVVELANQFDMLTMNASFIYAEEQDYVHLALEVNKLNKTKSNGLQIPVNLKHLYSDNYVALIERNLDAYRTYLDKPLEEVIFVVILDDAWLHNVGAEINYELLWERTKSLKAKGYGFDFVSHMGLRDVDTEHVQAALMRTIRKLNKGFYKLAVDSGEAKMRRFDTLKNFAESVELVFHEGEIYIRPAVSEKSNIFHERMRFADAWTPEALMTHCVERFNTNLELAAGMKDCQDCARMTDCSKRFIHDVMALVETGDCLTALKPIPLPA